MSSDENKDSIRRYMRAVDEIQTSDWSVLEGPTASGRTQRMRPQPYQPDSP